MFNVVDEPFSTSSETPSLHHVVNTPIGDEIVNPGECERPTRFMNNEEILRVLREADPFRAKTVPAMPAVMRRA